MKKTAYTYLTNNQEYKKHYKKKILLRIILLACLSIIDSIALIINNKITYYSKTINNIHKKTSYITTINLITIICLTSILLLSFILIMYDFKMKPSFCEIGIITNILKTSKTKGFFIPQQDDFYKYETVLNLTDTTKYIIQTPSKTNKQLLYKNDKVIIWKSGFDNKIYTIPYR